MTIRPLGGLFDNLTRFRDVRSARASSWDQTGRNQDYWVIPPGESIVLADIEGPGCITHIWMTQFCRRILGPGIIDPYMGHYVAPIFEIHNALGLNWEVSDPYYYRKILLKMYWDDQDHPSVLAPLGDFFGIGHSIAANYHCLPFAVTVKPEEQFLFGGNAGLNCYLPMPFKKRARIEIENQNDAPYGQYFYIDYELHREDEAEDIAHFHAHWKRDNPCDGWGPQLQTNSPETNVVNLSGDGNYVVLETEGKGHYVGCNLSVAHFQGTWWGEGDDMIFIDEDTWPPSMHGTGTEDYFNHAWGMQTNAFPMCGTILHESDMPGYQVSYRFHLTDPVHFAERIKVTIEHGHGNHLSDDWASTAYWYQALPSKPLDMPPADDRIPTRMESSLNPTNSPHDSAPAGELTDEMRSMLSAAAERGERYLQARAVETEKKIEMTRQRSRGNIEQARKIRDSFK